MNTSRFGANSMKAGALAACFLLVGLGVIGCTEAIDDEEPSPRDGDGSLHVEPELYEDAMGDTCRDAGIALEIEGAEDWIDCKIDEPPQGDNIYTDADDFEANGSDPELCAELLEIGMDIYDTERGEEMDWESLNDQEIIAVLVKGGTDANLYYYQPPVTEDEGLHSPFPPGQDNTWADISHVSFCIGAPEPVERELTVTKTVDAIAEGTYQWEIDKSVDPDYHELVQENGEWLESGISDYLVEVDVVGVSEEFAVFGTITIENETDADAQITGVTDVVNGTDATVDCDVVFEPYYLLEAGETLECDYEATGLTGDETTNTTTVMVTAESLVDGGVAVEPVVFPDATEILDEVTVVDQLEDEDEVTLGTCNVDDAPCQFPYQREFFCPEDEGFWENVATIVETGQFDTAEVEVVCVIVDEPTPPKDPKPKPPKDEPDEPIVDDPTPPDDDKPPKNEPDEPIVDDPTPPKDEKPPKDDDDDNDDDYYQVT